MHIDPVLAGIIAGVLGILVGVERADPGAFSRFLSSMWDALAGIFRALREVIWTVPRLLGRWLDDVAAARRAEQDPVAALTAHELWDLCTCTSTSRAVSILALSGDVLDHRCTQCWLPRFIGPEQLTVTDADEYGRRLRAAVTRASGGVADDPRPASYAGGPSMSPSIRPRPVRPEPLTLCGHPDAEYEVVRAFSGEVVAAWGRCPTCARSRR